MNRQMCLCVRQLTIWFCKASLGWQVPVRARNRAQGMSIWQYKLKRQKNPYSKFYVQSFTNARIFQCYFNMIAFPMWTDRWCWYSEQTLASLLFHSLALIWIKTPSAWIHAGFCRVWESPLTHGSDCRARALVCRNPFCREHILNTSFRISLLAVFSSSIRFSPNNAPANICPWAPF